MRLSLTLFVLGWTFTIAGARAAPTVEIRHAAARVVVVPQARGDILATVLKSNARLPLRITRLGRRVLIEGDLAHRPHGCRTISGQSGVGVSGRGEIALRDMPEVVIYTPMDARVSAGDAVFGSVGRSDSLEFANRGCGNWTIGNVRGHLRLSQAGSGDARAGAVGSADLSVAGTGAIATREVRGGLTAVSSGSGDIAAASVFGPLNARIAGSGDIRSPAGKVTQMTASVAGSGGVRFGGVARNLSASIAGSGGVTVAQVTGAVSKHVFGSGEVRVGR